MDDARVNRVGGGLAGGLVAVGSLGVVVALFGQQADQESRVTALSYLPLAASAALMLWQRPRLPITWALTVMAGAWTLALLGPVTDPWRHGEGVASRLFDTGVSVTWPLLFPLLPVVLTLFPSAPTSRRGKALLGTELATIGVTMATFAVHADDGDPAWLFHIDQVALVTLLGCGVLAVGRLVAIRRRSAGRERAQVSLVLAAGLAVVGLYVVGGMLTLIFGSGPPNAVGEAVTGFLVVGAIPAAITTALLRYRLYDVELVVNRALVWSALVIVVTAAAVLLTRAVAEILGRTPPDPVLVVVPCLVVAVAALPLRRVLQRGADAIVPALDGDRQAFGALAGRLDSAVPVDQVPALVAEGLGVGLGFTGVRLHEDTDDGSVVLAQWGTPGGGDGAVQELRHAGVSVGSLVVWPAPDDRQHELLAGLAAHAAVALHASRLTRDLERSRERLVWGREEERRRLRRDLHDELAPSLAGIRLAVAAARSRGADPAGDPLLAQAQQEAGDAVDVVRRILDDLRPPALDELGLAGAIGRRADSLHRPGEFEVELQAHLVARRLPPALEVAAYRIASEALANAARHAKARRCRVLLGVDDREVSIAVEDDGEGMPRAYVPGVGLRSMRERAETLGGTLTLSSLVPNGTRVAALIPRSAPVVAER